MENGYKLFIDDLRYPVDEKSLIARNIEEAKDIIRDLGCPTEIAFDHDLGDEGGEIMDFIHWFIDCDLDGIIVMPENFSYTVHSMNPIGANNIKSVLESYFKFKREN